MLGDTTHLEPSFCPTCKGRLDAATGLELGTKPKKGDVTVCLYCATALQFDAQMQLVLLTDREVARMPKKAKRQLVMSVAMVKAFLADQRRKARMH